MITIRELNIDLQEFHLRGINLNIAKNEFFILMGPTGAGKTVLLEAIAGLIPLMSGKILIGEREITGLPPEKRGISIVYQDYALFPHLTVLENITYGLHFHKIGKSHAEKRLDLLLEVLSLFGLKQRFPVNLSGGEKQRVALARALMVEPKVLLLDEPLSSLDPNFREEVRGALKRLHQSSDTTFLMVTHDFTDVLSLAGRAAVMNKGLIEQTGDVKEIFEKPSSPFVADFVGMKNIFSVKFNGTKALLKDLILELGRDVKNSHGYVAIRPESIFLSKDKITSSMINTFRGIVFKVLNQGFYYEIHVKTGGAVFKTLITKSAFFESGLEKGDSAYLSFKSTAIHNF